MDILCIYHCNCADGFGSAWVVREFCRQRDIGVEFHAGVYQDAPPDVRHKNVVLVDFSYKRAVLEDMGRGANAILILDHHKSAAEDLAGLPAPRVGFSIKSDMGEIALNASMSGSLPIEALFDMNKSGVGLTWDFFFPDKPRPKLIDHIEDRDLWKFALPGTREIQANVFSYPYDFEVWDRLMAADPQTLAAEGAAIERKHFKDIGELVKVVTRPMKIGGHVVPVANLPYTLTSDAGNLLAEGKPFAACYWDTPEGRVFSLRSKPEGLDVSAIASQYGGGGHKNASGFRVPFDQLGQFEP